MTQHLYFVSVLGRQEGSAKWWFMWINEEEVVEKNNFFPQETIIIKIYKN